MSDTMPLPARIAQTLAEEIIRGDHDPGARLGQDQLAQRFACSHVPVREALAQLVAMELATTAPRRGVRVAEVTPEDHRDILDMRLALEPLAVSLAAARVTPQQLERIEALRQDCDAAQEAIGWERANRAFHMAILTPSNRPRLLQTVEGLQRLSARHFHSKWRESWVRKSDAEHHAIVQAMSHGDGASASAILRRHLARG
ncbi:MAG: GntR family transcriptional regulator [Rhodobacterales bacterium]|nr:MAG: GntR family transcriptional regulator [Rhodobacterales bacterium]